MKRYSEYKDSGVEWIGEIPSHWGMSTLKKYFTFEKGKNASMYTKEYVSEREGEYPVYSGQTANEGIMGKINRYEYDLNECIFTTTVGAKVMTASYLKGKFTLSQNCLIMKPRTNNISVKYIYYYIQPLFNYERALIPSYMQPSLRIEDLNSYKIIIPMINEQSKIVTYLDKKTVQINNLINKKEELIEMLRASRTKLISETVTKGLDKDVFMKDSGVEWIGEIPSHYEVKKLRYLGNLQNGISKGAEEFGLGYPFISYGDVYKNSSIPNEIEGLVNSSKEDRCIYSVIEGDVFFTRTSEIIEEIGFASTCLETISDATFAGFLIRFRQNNNDLYKGYSKYYFRSDIHRKFFVKEMNLVTRASLGQSLLKNLPVVIPSYEEQIEISKYLDKQVTIINNSISKIEEQIELLKKAKKKLITEVVTGKIDVINL